VTTDLPDVARPDHLTEALRRHGVLSAGRVRDVTAKGPRDLLMSRIVRLELTYEGAAERAPASLILKTWRPREGVPDAWSAREVLFYDTVAPATPAGLLLRCFDAGRSPETKGEPRRGDLHACPNGEAHSLNPKAYLRHAIAKVADGHRINRIHELMPWHRP
jgi:hypothetical protein